MLTDAQKCSSEQIFIYLSNRNLISFTRDLNVHQFMIIKIFYINIDISWLL